MTAMCFSSVLGELNQPAYVTYEVKRVPVYTVNSHFHTLLLHHSDVITGVYTSQVSLGFKSPAIQAKSAYYFYRVSQRHHFTVLVPLNHMKRAHHIKSSPGSTNSTEAKFLSLSLFFFNLMILT